MSVPRLIWTDNMFCALAAFSPLGIPVHRVSSAYWGKSLAMAMEKAMGYNPDYLITIDYDSLYSQKDVEELIALMEAHPEADAICPIQMKRDCCEVLFFQEGDNGEKPFDREDFRADLTLLKHGHFGLTIFRVTSLADFKKPWFLHTIKENGEYDVDADISFWWKWAESGRKLFLANRVAIGHIQTIPTWPDWQLAPLHQPMRNYDEVGKPVQAWPPPFYDLASDEDKPKITSDPFSSQFYLEHCKKNVYSQFGEDGIVATIFEHIGTENKWCMEIGAADGLYTSNTRHLIEQGWNAVLIEGNDEMFGRLLELYKDNPNVYCIHGMVDDLDAALAETPIPQDFDLASIDIDGQDYYLWLSMLKYRPRVVLCECACMNPERPIPTRGGDGQAGSNAIEGLAWAKRYRPLCVLETNVLSIIEEMIDKFEDSRMSLKVLEE